MLNRSCFVENEISGNLEREREINRDTKPGELAKRSELLKMQLGYLV